MRRHSDKRGFTLVEVLLASIILSLGLFSVLASLMQSQKMMLASRDFETAQKVLAWAEMAHPMPQPEDVSDDPLTNDKLNVDEETADEIVSTLETAELDLQLSRQEREDIQGYSFKREVDDIDDEELKRRGYIYCVRTTVTWGRDRSTGKHQEDVTIKLWRKE